MKILILGGTGAMGTPLAQLLAKNNEVFVTSRKQKESQGNINYIQGDSKDLDFLKKILKNKYDVIIDFMVYSTAQFKERINDFLSNCKQYFFFSSSRVYANTEGAKITEDSPRLLDVIQDVDYLNTDEYALAKARQEDILKNSGYNNWTIIRPYITFNDQRIQLGVFEKEHWLFRALTGRSIVLPEDIANAKTTLTYGLDVARVIEKLVDNKQALGAIFHITTSESKTWKEILQIYVNTIERFTSVRPKIKYLSDSKTLQRVWNEYQIKYDRLYDREFDNSKVVNVSGFSDFTKLEDALQLCLSEFIKSQQYIYIDWRYEAWADRMSGEKAKLKDIKGFKNKIKYILVRNNII